MKYIRGAVPAASAAFGRPVARASVVELKDGRKGSRDPSGAGSAPAAGRRTPAAASGMTFRGYKRPLDPRIYPLSELTSGVRGMSDIGEAGKARLKCNWTLERRGVGDPPADVVDFARTQAKATIGASAECFDSYLSCRQRAESTNNPACKCIQRQETVDVETYEFMWEPRAWLGTTTDCYKTIWTINVTFDCLNSHVGVGACTYMEERTQDERGGW